MSSNNAYTAVQVTIYKPAFQRSLGLVSLTAAAAAAAGQTDVSKPPMQCCMAVLHNAASF
jgi:hypothetical protein